MTTIASLRQSFKCESRMAYGSRALYIRERRSSLPPSVAADYVNRVARGATPSDLPIEAPVADPTADVSLRMTALGWCRQEHVHQDVDMPLWFDLGYTFPG